MKIGLDIRMIGNSGIGTTIRGLLGHLSADQMKQLTLFGHAGTRAGPGSSFVEVPYPIYGLKQHFLYPPLLRREKLSLFHMPHFDVPFFYRGPFVATVHDLIHYLYPEYSTKPFTKTYSGWMLNHVASRAKKIITVSENTKKDLIRCFPQSDGKIEVLYPGVDDEFQPADEPRKEQVLAKYDLASGYLLYVGNIRPSKNTLNLLKGFAAVERGNRECPPLVLVGNNFFKNKDIEKMGKKIRHIPHVEKTELPALYSAAALFVFPSLYEGFGLPPLEAMACGAPVLASRAASLPEVCGEAAEYLEGTSDRHIAEKLSLLLASPDRRRELREKGFLQTRRFSWKKFAEGTWRIYESLA